MNVLLILSLLLFKHYIADFVLQTKYQYKNKGCYGRFGGILHALLHAIGTFIVLVCFFNWKIALCSALADGLIHYHIDWIKEKINSHFHLTPDKSGFWSVLGADQLLHQLTYVMILYLIY